MGGGQFFNNSSRKNKIADNSATLGPLGKICGLGRRVASSLGVANKYLVGFCSQPKLFLGSKCLPALHFLGQKFNMRPNAGCKKEKTMASYACDRKPPGPKYCD